VISQHVEKRDWVPICFAQLDRLLGLS